MLNTSTDFLASQMLKKFKNKRIKIKNWKIESKLINIELKQDKLH